MGLYIAFVSVFAMVAIILHAAPYDPPHVPATIPGTVLPCSTTGCAAHASTIAAGRLACDNCAGYLNARAAGA